jgi:hypothetical protein
MPPKKTKIRVCTYCGKQGHWVHECRTKASEKNKNKNNGNGNGNGNNQNNQNQQNNGRHCDFCGSKDHWSAYCSKKQETSTGNSSGFVMAAPWQVAPPQLEALWCKWCNSGLHSTAGCQNTNSQVEVMVMPEIKDNYCDRCGYKGHVSKNCCNPYPDQKCLFCQRPGHVFQDCVRREEPRIREMLASLPARQSDPIVKKDEPSQNMSNTISTFKRRREALDQSQQATNSFIANLVNATTHKETQDIVPVRSHELVHIMDGVLAWEQGDDCNLWGKDLTETVKAMKMYHLSEGVNFFRIFFAIHRLEAGFNIYCAHAGCRGNALIITPEFQTVNVSTRSGYPRDQPEHAVFLASSCSHSDFSFEWRRSRIEEGDLTPLYLLQAAHSNPIFHQFTELKAGITTRDLDLEYDAMLEMDKQRQALDAEQQKFAEASTKLRLQEAVFKRHAELLGSPMDWKAPTPVTNKFLTPTSPFSPRKRAWGDTVMADAPFTRYDRRFDTGVDSSPKRARFDEPRPAHQHDDNTRQYVEPEGHRDGRGNDRGRADNQGETSYNKNGNSKYQNDGKDKWRNDGKPKNSDYKGKNKDNDYKGKNKDNGYKGKNKSNDYKGKQNDRAKDGYDQGGNGGRSGSPTGSVGSIG